MKRVVTAFALSTLIFFPAVMAEEVRAESAVVDKQTQSEVQGEYLYLGFGPLGQVGVLVLRPGEIPGARVNNENVLDLDRAVVARILGIQLDGLSEKEVVAKLTESSQILGLSATPSGALNLPLTIEGRTVYVPLSRVPRIRESFTPNIAFGPGGGALGLTYSQARERSGFSLGGGITLEDYSSIGGGVSGSYQWQGENYQSRVLGRVGAGTDGVYLGLDYLHGQFNVLGEWEHTYGFGAGISNASPTARFRYANGDVSVDAGIGSLMGLPVTGILVRRRGIDPVVVPNVAAEVWTLASGRAPLNAGVILVPGTFVPAPFIVPELLPAEIAMTPLEYQSLRVKQIGDSSLALQEGFNKGLKGRVEGYVTRHLKAGGSVEWPEAAMGLHVLPTSEHGSGRFDQIVKTFQETTGISAQGLDREGVQKAVVKWFISRNRDLWNSLNENERSDMEKFVSSYVHPVPVPSYGEIRKRDGASSYRDRYAEAFEVKVWVSDSVKEENGTLFIEVKTKIVLGLRSTEASGISQDAPMVEMDNETFVRLVKVQLDSDKRIAKEQAALLRQQAEQERATFVRSIYSQLVPSYNRREKLPMNEVKDNLLKLAFVRA